MESDSVNDSLLHDLEVRAAAADLMHRYQRLVDTKDLDGLANIVIDDLELQRRQGSGQGREAFLDLYRGFVASDVDVAQHMVTNIMVRALPEDGRYRIDSSFFVITTHETGDARMIWGRYSDDMVRQGKNWLYAAKRIDVVRTALIPKESLVSGEISSFGPMVPDATLGAPA